MKRFKISVAKNLIKKYRRYLTIDIKKFTNRKVFLLTFTTILRANNSVPKRLKLDLSKVKHWFNYVKQIFRLPNGERNQSHHNQFVLLDSERRVKGICNMMVMTMFF